jgi:hypothetical protein
LGRRENCIEITESKSTDGSNITRGGVNVFTVDGTEHSEGCETYRIGWHKICNFRRVSSGCLLTSFTSTSLTLITIANFTEIPIWGRGGGYCTGNLFGGRKSSSGGSKLGRRTQSVLRRKPKSAELMVDGRKVGLAV